MSGVNKVILVGNLGADPELRYTGSGTAVCDMRLATSRRWRNKQGDLQEDTQWHRVVVWGKQGENCKEYLAKGRQVFVEGRLQTRKWEDNEGNTRFTTEVVAQDVRFLGGGHKQEVDQQVAPTESEDQQAEQQEQEEEEQQLDHRNIDF